jgi:hypothetical protein
MVQSLCACRVSENWSLSTKTVDIIPLLRGGDGALARDGHAAVGTGALDADGVLGAVAVAARPHVDDGQVALALVNRLGRGGRDDGGRKSGEENESLRELHFEWFSSKAFYCRRKVV